MNKIKTAIIGANGYIGKHLAFYLLQMGITPMCYDIQDEERENYKKVDLINKEAVKDIDLNVDYIFMFAGHKGLVGSAIWNNLKKRGYNNLVGRSHKELDLTDQYAVMTATTRRLVGTTIYSL